MTKNVVDLYNQFRHIDQAEIKELDLFLACLPDELQKSLRSVNSEDFKKTYQYNQLKDLIFKKELTDIDASNLLYTVVQCILLKKCTMREGATLLLFYGVLSCFEQTNHLDKCFIENGSIVIKNFYYESSLPAFPHILLSYEVDIQRDGILIKSYVIPPFTDPEYGKCMLPFAGNVYVANIARHALANKMRCIPVPTLLSQEIADKFKFSQSYEAHGIRGLTYFDLLNHDIFHLDIELRNLMPQNTDRIKFCDWLCDQIKVREPGKIRKGYINVLFKVLDEGISASVPQQIQYSKLFDLNEKKKIVSKLLDDNLYNSLDRHMKDDAIEISHMIIDTDVATRMTESVTEQIKTIPAEASVEQEKATSDIVEILEDAIDTANKILNSDVAPTTTKPVTEQPETSPAEESVEQVSVTSNIFDIFKEKHRICFEKEKSGCFGKWRSSQMQEKINAGSITNIDQVRNAAIQHSSFFRKSRSQKILDDMEREGIFSKCNL